MQLFLENFWASAQSILETEIIERQQLQEALRESQEEIQQKDIQLEQTQQELQRTKDYLIQSQKMSSLSQQIAGIADQIRNPTNFIISNLNYVTQYTEDLLDIIHLYAKHYPQPASEIQSAIEEVDLDFLIEDLPKLLSSLNLGANRLREITVPLYNYFGEAYQPEMMAVNFHEGIDMTLLILQPRLKASIRYPAIEVIKEYGELPLVECYPGLLNQMCMTFLSFAINAVQERASTEMSRQTTNPSEIATDYSPTITIRTGISVDKTHVLIQIADNGSGMTEESQRRLFDPPSMAKPISKTICTELPLSISHQIVVEKHRGQLKCVSALGKGTEFTIEIPIRQSHQQPS